ncbi:MAG: crossover junction endodeoxyribonuclease RuvC [Pirellulaceae bacterium]|nr:crossover junction endodeoxyribonuclease RuvC [Pirellulaceae bacterium]
MIESQEKILGIDPGLNITGYGVLTAVSNRIIEAGVIRIGRNQPMESRLEELYEGVVDVVESLKPSFMAVEDLYSHYERPKTAIIMGHARGVILLAARKSGIPVTTYAATKVKRVMTGNGRASKSQMQTAVCRHLKLDAVPEPPDVADALAIAICHGHHLQTDHPQDITNL